MARRQLPSWSHVRPYFQAGGITLSPVERRLAGAASIWDLREIARRHVPRAVFDYVDGAADGEISLRRMRDAFARVEFSPAVLRDVSSVDCSTDILGKRSELPVVFGPTGFTRLMNCAGETAVALVADDAGIPYALSTMGTTSPEVLAVAAPTAEKWFQLYLWRDRAAGREIVARAEAAGFTALILTVDTPVAGARLRDVRNGFAIPPAPSLRTMIDIGMHPGWWFNLLTTEPLEFASLTAWHGTVADLVDRIFDPSATIADVGWLRSIWRGPLIVKGVMTVGDALAVVDAGADAIVLSNHGGRQLDRSPTPLEKLPSITAAVQGRAEVYLDGGIMDGADVVAAVAMGAQACLVGRAYLYGLMAGGQRGVMKSAQLLRSQIKRTMQLLGVTDVGSLTTDHARVRDP